PPPVSLSDWQPRPAFPSSAYTTVTHWWGSAMEFDGVLFANDKRTAFLEYIDLPSRTGAPLELAICLGPKGQRDRDLWSKHGWSVREARTVSSPAAESQASIQSSGGEFSCAKGSCVRRENSWVSDRTVCSLASGKPAVVQYTGPSRYLPDADGLFRFRDVEQAARCLEAAAADYERQSRQARALAEEFFDAPKVAKRLLERALA